MRESSRRSTIGIAARQRIADDDEIGLCGIQMFGAIARIQMHAERGELVAHRRIDVRVATGDAVPELARQRGDAAHEGSTDS
jgi:hypothetical protein